MLSNHLFGGSMNITIPNPYGSLSVLILTASLAGCGGGGSDDTSSTPSSPSPTPTPMSNIIVPDEQLLRGDSVELILDSTSANIANIQWQQTSGNSVVMVTDTAKVLAFSAQSAGDYSFSVQYQVNGQTQQASATVSISDQQAQITARLGQEVAAENKVSLRAFVEDNINTSTISWQQLSGTTTALGETDGQQAIYFDAPNVSQAQILTFEVSAENNSGQTVQDTVSIVVNPKSAIASSAYFDERVADVFAYDSNSPYANTLVGCVYSNELTSSCTFNQLPLIADDTLTPTVDDIMERVVVSHQWMGDRFKEFLQQHDVNGDFKRLLRATSAIVISYDVRPAFYWAATGAIYLDPEFLWLTPDERDTINEAPDYRSNFGDTLQFDFLWRFVRDNDYASNGYARSNRQSRTLSDIEYRLAYLLYHELAHANDFFPSTKWGNYSQNDRILDAATDGLTQSDQLDVQYPLQSNLIKNLAQVRFGGNDATSSQQALLPADISPEFEPDGGVYFYSFFTIREDFAMLFDELMMYARYGVQRDVAITNNPDSNASGSDYIVHWGQRGRISEPQLYDRALFTANRVLPEFDATTALNNLPDTTQMQSGQNWIENLLLPSPFKQSLATGLLKKQAARNLPHHGDYQFYHKPLPKH